MMMKINKKRKKIKTGENKMSKNRNVELYFCIVLLTIILCLFIIGVSLDDLVKLVRFLILIIKLMRDINAFLVNDSLTISTIFLS